MKFLLSLLLGVLSLSTGDAVRIRNRVNTNQEVAVDDSSSFSAPAGTIAAYNGHIYYTNPATQIKHLRPTAQVAQTPATLNGKLAQVSYDGSTLCGANSAQEIFCSYKKNVTGASDVIDWIQLPGAAQQVVVKGHHIVAINRASQIWYGTYDNIAGKLLTPGWTQIPGALSQVSISGNTMCGCNPAQQIYCHDSGFVQNPQWRLMAGAGTQLFLSGSTIVVVNSAGLIYQGKYTPGTNNPGWSLLPGTLNQITIDPITHKTWGINTAGQVWERPIVAIVDWTRYE